VSPVKGTEKHTTTCTCLGSVHTHPVQDGMGRHPAPALGRQHTLRWWLFYVVLPVSPTRRSTLRSSPDVATRLGVENSSPPSLWREQPSACTSVRRDCAEQPLDWPWYRSFYTKPTTTSTKKNPGPKLPRPGVRDSRAPSCRGARHNSPLVPNWGWNARRFLILFDEERPPPC